ncbi:Lrp/AsnC family transcriptional regulator [Flavobacterium amniphilum]|uniref:Lrp/AsnC family transcriptional regulator n=1 Tax=Flavobacterium amniphilum TaxID=1834035 RepID=UPI00202ABE9A|nr:Lrp/AsnC family transcriptional regulator [Flavobacterium amniphilum]MCL9806545.1 Lrp/AsnC family transcriptional regulator [Flavobacterium amniphilum]
MMDDLDYRILAILQKDNLTPQRDIGDKIGLSAPAVQRRIKKMREEGIIEKDIAVVDRDKVGSNVTIIVEIFLERKKINEIDAIRKEFSSVPEIQQCFHITGESDFLLIMVVPSMSYYENLTRKIFFGNESIKRFRTSVVMGISKNSLEIPLNNFL